MSDDGSKTLCAYVEAELQIKDPKASILNSYNLQLTTVRGADAAQ